MMEIIDIPFGARDSELNGFEYTIPKGMTAEIKDGKVIMKKQESEDERIRKAILNFIKVSQEVKSLTTKEYSKWIDWLEKQKIVADIPDELVKCYKEFCEQGGREVASLINALNGFNEIEKQKEQKPNFDTHWENGSIVCEQKEQKPEWKPQPESLEALMYAIDGKWDMISPTSYLSRRLEDLYEGLVNTFNVDESLLAELPKVASRAYTAEDIEELRELKRKIEASMEQKPAEWDKLQEDFRNINEAFEDGKKEVIEHPEKYGLCKRIKATINGEPVPTENHSVDIPLAEWSEEDQKSLNRAINICISDFGEDCETARFLKSLPERFSPQPKQEWNEEDEKTIDDAYCWLCEYAGSLIQKNYGKSSMLYGIANKLKFLQPQYHGDVTMTEAYKMGLEAGKVSSWKPSEEQMKALLNAEGKMRELKFVAIASKLADLYENLKKLM